MSKKNEKQVLDKDEQFDAGWSAVFYTPLFESMCEHIRIIRDEDSRCPGSGWAVAFSNGEIHVNPDKTGTSSEWSYVLAHCLLHYAFDHFKDKYHPRAWNAACDVYISQFLEAYGFGVPPANMLPVEEITGQSEEKIYNRFCSNSIPFQALSLGTAGGEPDIKGTEPAVDKKGNKIEWQKYFCQGLCEQATYSVGTAAGIHHVTPAQEALRWFMNSYPLFAALASSFELVEDAEVCQRMGIFIAAISADAREIYVNPARRFNEEETRFIMAHEFLHVGLRHHMRCLGRDPYLWNVACDFVINGWLVEMEVGCMPAGDVLYDRSLQGLSAEEVYDRIVQEGRRSRRLQTLRGKSECGDMLEPKHKEWWKIGDGISLDDFYRRALAQGLAAHESGMRGYLPAGLVEEIRALTQPPVDWDVELAQWFDSQFPPEEKKRSYARASRRQSASPDIALPRHVVDHGGDVRTFGVVIDTSGSMDRTILAKALGAIASYSRAREVPLARVVFCDADAYDQGYMSPDEIAGRVKVRGRGGTVLQPGINLLEKSADFPATGPILVITDGWCDVVRIKREHAFLLPQGCHLPFTPRGRVFYLR